MERDILSDLKAWFSGSSRKPVVLRGARQVGKTWVVREFCRHIDYDLIEINFEKEQDFIDIFSEKSPQKVLETLELLNGKEIDINKSILFLDEIQKAPHAFANLRWFYEDLPELAVIATGSLLDFTLDNHEFSMPVGRISYLFMEPMTFKEFLSAEGQNQLRDYLETISLTSHIPEAIHKKILDYFNHYLIIGGMPEAVNEWINSRSTVRVAEIHQNLLNTYIDDFNKYSGRIPPEKLRKVMNAVPNLLGKKFKFSNVDRNETAKSLNHCLELLCLARICHRVIHSSSQSIPLKAQENSKMFKVIFLDTGLASALQGIVLKSVDDITTIMRNNTGGITEQVVGQLLRVRSFKFSDPYLNYYVREKKGTESELDYVIQHNTAIVPIEVKSGATGSLKSLHMFMAERNLPVAIRFNQDKPSIVNVNIKTPLNIQAIYQLISLPCYLTEEISRLLDELFQ